MRALLTRDILQLSQLRTYTFHLVRLGPTHNEKCSLLPLLPPFEVDEGDFRVVAAPLQSMCPISIRPAVIDVGHHKQFANGKEQYDEERVQTGSLGGFFKSRWPSSLRDRDGSRGRNVFLDDLTWTSPLNEVP